MTKLYKNALRATLLALSVILLTGCSGASEPETTAPTTVQTTVQATEPALLEGQMEYEGKVYQLREDLTTLLLMGLDKDERPDEQIGYTNTMQSDFLLLLIIDEEAGTCEALHLNRDTMTKIRRLGIGGGAAGTFTGQLALAHTYGSGGSDSALNAVKAVSTLLNGVTIDHYMTLTMDAVGILNDLLGGVTVTVLEDMSDIDPALVKGAEVNLMGDQALLYVRSRMNVGDGTNLARMERQQQYLNGLYEKLVAVCKGESDFLSSALLKLANNFSSDCSVTQLEALEDILEECTVSPIRTIPGEAVVGDPYMEFYADEAALTETVVTLFYELVE